VKRIIGIPGDTLFMRHGNLFVNGAMVASPSQALPLPDIVADQPQPLFAWQHRIETATSRFGPPGTAPSLHRSLARIFEGRQCLCTTRTTQRKDLTTFGP
jgi:hypothetical protein